MHLGERGNRTLGMDPYDLRQRDVADFEGMGRPYRAIIVRETKKHEPDADDIIRAEGDGMILRIPVED